MLVKFKTWISERISSFIFLALIFFLLLWSEEPLFLYLSTLIIFFYSWYRKGNIIKAIFITFFFWPVWYLLFIILPFQRIFWSLLFIIFLILFFEEEMVGRLILLEIFTLAPLFFFIHNLLSLEWSLILTTFSFLIALTILKQNFFQPLFLSLFLFQINLLFLFLPIFSFWKFFLVTGFIVLLSELDSKKLTLVKL